MLAGGNDLIRVRLYEDDTTRGQSNLTKGRIAMRTNRANIYTEKAVNLNSVKFIQLAHH